MDQRWRTCRPDKPFSPERSFREGLSEYLDAAPPGNTGLSGVTVTLGGDAAAAVTTGNDGTYSFTVNALGSYTVTDTQSLSADRQTRIMLFVFNLELLPDETASAIRVEVKDAQNNVYPLLVEYVDRVTGVVGLSQINAKLPSQLENAGEVSISIRVGNAASNSALIRIN